MKGYKVFNPDWTCRGFQYEVGKTYKHDGELSICNKGFHFCRKASDCFNYYAFDCKNKVAEVEALGLVESDATKSVTNEIHVIREIPWNELLNIVNEGKGCTGLRNSGDCNTGDCNTGNWNTGNWNTGDRNTGNCNTGDCNTGNWNTGDCNTGNWNTGDRNTGNCNTGNWNTGDWNTGNCNTGFFNTITPPLFLFNKPIDLTRNEILQIKGVQVLSWNYEDNWWIYSCNMSDEEKKTHPEHETLGGYLKTVDFKTACAMMWEKLGDTEKQAVKNIPNFDAAVFKKVTGIKVENEQSD